MLGCLFLYLDILPRFWALHCWGQLCYTSPIHGNSDQLAAVRKILSCSLWCSVPAQPQKKAATIPTRRFSRLPEHRLSPRPTLRCNATYPSLPTKPNGRLFTLLESQSYHSSFLLCLLWCNLSILQETWLLVANQLPSPILSTRDSKSVS